MLQVRISISAPSAPGSAFTSASALSLVSPAVNRRSRWMEHAPGTAHNDGESERICVTAMGPFPRNGPSFRRGVSFSTSPNQAAQLVDRIVAALRRAGGARLPAQMHFDLHAPAVPSINPQPAGLRDHHAVWPNAVFLQYV